MDIVFKDGAGIGKSRTADGKSIAKSSAVGGGKIAINVGSKNYNATTRTLLSNEKVTPIVMRGDRPVATGRSGVSSLSVPPVFGDKLGERSGGKKSKVGFSSNASKFKSSSNETADHRATSTSKNNSVINKAVHSRQEKSDVRSTRTASKSTARLNSFKKRLSYGATTQKEVGNANTSSNQPNYSCTDKIKGKNDERDIGNVGKLGGELRGDVREEGTSNKRKQSEKDASAKAPSSSIATAKLKSKKSKPTKAHHYDVPKPQERKAQISFPPTSMITIHTKNTTRTSNDIKIFGHLEEEDDDGDEIQFGVNHFGMSVGSAEKEIESLPKKKRALRDASNTARRKKEQEGSAKDLKGTFYSCGRHHQMHLI